MVTPSEIVSLAQRFAAARFECAEDRDLFAAGCMDGPGVRAFLDEFSSAYDVDMATFLKVFHALGDDASGNRRVRAIGLDGKAFPLIPITPRLLADAANQHRWPLEYPTHTLRSSRWPLIAMFLLLALFVLAVTVLSADG